MLPVIVWAIHGSVDWFWEMPALTGPALAFLAVAGAIGPRAAPQPAAGSSAATGRLRLGGGFAGRGLPRGAVVLAATAAVLAATFVLGVPYLSAREVSVATAASARDPSGALDELKTAAQLDPLTAVPGRIGGTIALRMGQFAEAERRFRQAIAREPGGWFAWLGDGLAASELGDRARARHDFTVAASINSLQPAVTHALERVNTAHPLTPAQAFDMLLLHT
jgi:Tfp pilus assembly protein PilF